MDGFLCLDHEVLQGKRQVAMMCLTENYEAGTDLPGRISLVNLRELCCYLCQQRRRWIVGATDKKSLVAYQGSRVLGVPEQQIQLADGGTQPGQRRPLGRTD